MREFGKIKSNHYMKKHLLGLMAILSILGACQKNEVAFIYEPITLHATIEEENATKTVMDENNNILWSENDQIVAFMKSSYGHKYQVKPSFVGKSYADFSMVSSGNGTDLSAGNEWEHNVVYYPYSEDIECLKSGANYELEVNLPFEQVYVPDSFANGSMAMVAVSENDHIAFKNVLGGMKILLKGNQKVTSIMIEGKNNEQLSGNAVVTAYADDKTPTISMNSESSTSVTLNCSAGVQLNETHATEFIISLPPILFTSGFTVTVTDDADETYIVETDKANTIIRSSLLVMPEVTIASPSDIEQDSVNLSMSEAANCYIVSQKGSYTFETVKGNSLESVGMVKIAEVLWESFGTDVAPNIGDLVKSVSYSNNRITFKTADPFTEGNAVIAAKDEEGNILWSWHIWLTDKPQSQVYYNNAGTMMDRNLGATSATPGDICAHGLLYQWGRKDPFLGCSTNHYHKDLNQPIAKSTIAWPAQVNSSTPATNGTIEFAIAHPTTFIRPGKNYDWYYTGTNSTDHTRWPTSDSPKSIYDPCPAGWRVPNGGAEGVWSTALGVPWTIEEYSGKFDQINRGFDFAGELGEDLNIWYPAAGDASTYTAIESAGYWGFYWSATKYKSSSQSYLLFIQDEGKVIPAEHYGHFYAGSVRCVQDNGVESKDEMPSYIDEHKINHGPGIKIGYVVWAPVNCGYHKDHFQYGKLYQWGRKYGQGYYGDLCINNESGVAEVIGTWNDAGEQKLKSGPISLSYGQDSENADQFIYRTASDVKYGRDWCDTEHDYLWNSGSENEPIKTEYDPCPEGWRVPTWKELNALQENHSSFVEVNGQYGYWLSGPIEYSEGVPRIFLPAAGMNTHRGSSQFRGYYGYYFASNPAGTSETGRLQMTYKRVNMGGAYRSMGLSVRCVKE